VNDDDNCVSRDLSLHDDGKIIGEATVYLASAGDCRRAATVSVLSVDCRAIQSNWFYGIFRIGHGHC
jgi:hypothetical protein